MKLFGESIMESTHKLIALIFLCIPVIGSSQEINFNYLGKPTTKNDGYSPMYLKGIYAAKNTYGMRQSAVVASFKANSDNPFNFPVLGINSLYGLTQYVDRDSVALYADNTAPDYKPWEVITNAHITPTSIVSESIDYTKILPGMIIETKDSPKWTTYVISVAKGKIVTSGWVNMKTKHMGVPKSNILLVNPITKIWATNYNITLPSDSRAIKGVVQENGVVNNKTKSGIVNGVDTVILPYSKFGGASAYIARAANTGFNQQWNYGFLSLGNKYSFISKNTPANHVQVSFLDISDSEVGMQFSGSNKRHSLEWKSGDVITAAISPSGQIAKINYKTLLVKGNYHLNDEYARYIFTARDDITVSLPDEDNLIDGFTLKLSSLGDGKHTINLKSKLEIIGGEKFNNSNWNKDLIFIDSKWVIV